jgi:hypothetical protein
MVCLAACQHSVQNNNDAVRQGVIDHLAKAKYNLSGMDINISQVQFNGNEADATVSVTLKGQTGGMPMGFKYHLQQQNNKWVVVGRDTGSTAHGGGEPMSEPAGAANPHGGGAPPAMPAAGNPHGGGASQMPSPKDLPPTKKK